jgi:integrase
VGPPIDAVVFTRHSGRPLRRHDLTRAWKAACAVVGIDGVRPHDLRHHAAMVIAGNPNVTLRELMATIGHSSHVADAGTSTPRRYGAEASPTTSTA